MTEIPFAVDGIDGEFTVDADALKSYKTMKQLAQAETNPAGMFDAIERIYMGHDEEFIDRVGGIDNLGKLNDAALAAVADAKKSLDSSRATNTTATK